MASHLENERKHGQFASILIIQERNEQKNEKVEELLKRPYFTLDKVSGHVPYRWIPEMGEGSGCRHRSGRTLFSYFNSYTQKYTGIDYDKEAAYRQHYDRDNAEMILKIYKYLEGKHKGAELKLDYDGIIPLYAAVVMENLELMEYLLAEGTFDVNAQIMGKTCIFSIEEPETTEYGREWKKETNTLQGC